MNEPLRQHAPEDDGERESAGHSLMEGLGLSAFIPKPRAKAADIRSRRLMIRTVQFLLAVLAVGTLGALMWAAYSGHEENRFNLGFSSVEHKEGTPVMVQPKFEGVDADGQPYVITAAKATQATPEIAELVTVQADITLKDGRWVSVLAKTGVIEVKKKKILLRGDVQFHYDGGISFYTEEAFIDASINHMHGTKPVQGQSLNGTIRADGFDVSSKDGIIRFAPNAHVTLMVDGGE